MHTVFFVITTIIQLYIFILLLRVWMQCVQVDFYNPFSQFVFKVTQPIVGPLCRVIPVIGSVNISTVIVALILCIANVVFSLWVTNTLLMLKISIIPIGIILLLTYIGKLFFWMILMRAIISWVRQAHNPIDQLLYELTEPLMLAIRRIIPRVGGLDFSSMIVMFILITLHYLRLDVLMIVDPTLTKLLNTLGIV
ncbi:hypothetical protein GFV14_00405 [Candidatus Hartigia pinicola]|nr:hypothetical protein GFV14_00405 [Candidatus Hartigia pinicola]